MDIFIKTTKYSTEFKMQKKLNYLIERSDTKY